MQASVSWAEALMISPGYAQKLWEKRLTKTGQYFMEDNGILLDIKQAREKN